MDLIEIATEIAARAHRGQVRKNGEPYIRHPLRVMARLLDLPRDNPNREAVLCAALLHDVLEDTHVPAAAIKAIFGDHVLEIVESVTKRPSETYRQFVLRSAQHPLGRLVKIADVQDNLERIDEVPEDKGRKMLKTRYEWAMKTLTGRNG